MYASSDPRSSLQSGKPIGQKATGPFRQPEIGAFDNTPPQESSATHEGWYLRGRNFVLHQTKVKDGAEFSRTNQPDEYVALTLDPDLTMEITTADGTHSVPGYSIAIIPPGDSKIVVHGEGLLTMLYSPRSKDLVAKCPNAAAFDEPDPRIPPLQLWPDPPEGFRLRHYSLNIPPKEGRFGRIFRCTTLMVNVLEPREGLRDRAEVSPHHHDDFEQLSLALKGRFRHLLRWSWTSNMNHWHEDQAIDCGAPSACIIPPPIIHTSLSTGEETNQLVDIFAPPRRDFSMQDGWVLNAKDYPIPDDPQS